MIPKTKKKQYIVSTADTIVTVAIFSRTNKLLADTLSLEVLLCLLRKEISRLS